VDARFGGACAVRARRKQIEGAVAPAPRFFATTKKQRRTHSRSVQQKKNQQKKTGRDEIPTNGVRAAVPCERA